jgi:lysine/ornithine N-monooxygenase
LSKIDIVIIGAGPYGLSLAAHLGAQNIEHRIFGRPMWFWSQVAKAGSERYLKSFCFATNLSSPKPGFTLVDYNRPRGLETFDPCSMANFTSYGQWFQQHNAPWVEPVDVVNVERENDAFAVTLTSGERVIAAHVVVATGLSNFATSPSILSFLPANLASHTSEIESFESFNGRSVAVIGAGQSALEAAALLHEGGALPQLLVREDKVLWHTRVSSSRSRWQQVRKPISGLGVGPKAWALVNYPGALHSLPDQWRVWLTRNHLPPEGAWWLRKRVEDRVPIHLRTRVIDARVSGGQVALRLSDTLGTGNRELKVDHVISGSGYDIDLQRLLFLDPKLRNEVRCFMGSPSLDASFGSSVPELYFVGPSSAKSFGPLFRFVVGADYAARTVSARLASQLSASAPSKASIAA